MATALGVMILTCRLQAWLSVRGLRLARECPACVSLGDTVTVKIAVSSEYAFKRPLVTVTDVLPEEMEATNQSPSLPVAPSSDSPVYTQYQFEARKRGKFCIRSMFVQGSDALGLVRMRRRYSANESELLVLPVPIPFEVRLPHSAGWGFSESDHGRSRGQGIEPRGVREYADGDSQRYIHWRSSARTGQLMVKEFETGALARAYLFVQSPEGKSHRRDDSDLLDRMCANAAYLCDCLLGHGAEVFLPAQLGNFGAAGISQRHELLKALAEVPMDSDKTVGEQLASAVPMIGHGSTVYLFLCHPAPDLGRELSRLASQSVKTVAILYSRMEDAFVTLLQQAGATVQFEVRS